MTAKNKSLRRNPLLSKLTLILSIVVLVVAISLTSVVLFQKLYYTPFWVNGQSMYPTLNEDAKYEDGTLIGDHRVGETIGNYDVDYGFMDSHQKRIDEIERFDVVIFKAREDVISYNIKRVIALPGESFYFTYSPGENIHGDLYIKEVGKENFELVEQPIDENFLRKGDYPTKYREPTTLEDNEYFVVGDNRLIGNSLDSRSTGPIQKDLILGVAIGINASCTLIEENGNIVPTNIKHFKPRFF